MSGMAVSRLLEERKIWLQGHKKDFLAKPIKNSDGSLNMLVWKCFVPGKKGTFWGGRQYQVKMTFTEDYPIKPPVCKFEPTIFHPNVFRCGTICLTLLDASGDWRPSLRFQDIFDGIQNMLCEPNMKISAYSLPHSIYRQNRADYERMARESFRAMPQPKLKVKRVLKKK